MIEYTEIIDFAKDNSALFIALVTGLISLLGYILYFVKYMKNKAKLDYFYVSKMVRHNKKAEFDLEYWMTCIFILSIVSVIIFVESIYEFWMTNRWIMLSVYFVVSFIICYFVYYIFSYSLLKNAICDDNEYKKMIIKKTLCTTIKYTIFILGMYWVFACEKPYMSIFILVLLGSFFLIYDYYTAKEMTRVFTKTYELVNIDNVDYCIISAINNGEYYLEEVSVEKDKNDEITIHMDAFRVANISDKKIKQCACKKMKRMYGNREVPDKLLNIDMIKKAGDLLTLFRSGSRVGDEQKRKRG